jgi:hypothetical protein
MLSGLQEVDSLSPGDFSKDQSAEHCNGVRRRTVKVPGGFSRRVKAGHRPHIAQDFCLPVGGETTECISNRADQGICQKRWLGDRPRPLAKISLLAPSRPSNIWRGSSRSGWGKILG